MRKKATFQRGRICATFEQKAESEFRFDSLLTAQNEKALRKKSSWPWPRGLGVSLDGVRRCTEVGRGRFILLPIVEGSDNDPMATFSL